MCITCALLCQPSLNCNVRPFVAVACLPTPGENIMEACSLSRNVSRRVFVQGLGLISASLVLGVIGGCDLEKLIDAIVHRPIRRRLRAGSPEVDADIATYKQAVTLMKDLDNTNPGDPRSWKNQAGIHGTVAGGF